MEDRLKEKMTITALQSLCIDQFIVQAAKTAKILRNLYQNLSYGDSHTTYPFSEQLANIALDSIFEEELINLENRR